MYAAPFQGGFLFSNFQYFLKVVIISMLFDLSVYLIQNSCIFDSSNKRNIMYYLRFTRTKDTTNSFDHFTGEELNGVCCYELDCNEDGLYLAIRQQASKDTTFLKANDGYFIVFEGSKIADNPYGYGVIAEVHNIVESGKVEWCGEVNSYKIV